LYPKNMVPMDVMRYAGRNPDFPHEPTLDQFFGEAKFESYRALGQHEIETMLDAQVGPLDIPDLFSIAGDYSRPWPPNKQP
jgi:hypothetical protein